MDTAGSVQTSLDKAGRQGQASHHYTWDCDRTMVPRRPAISPLTGACDSDPRLFSIEHACKGRRRGPFQQRIAAPQQPKAPGSMAFESAINTDESNTEQDKARELAARDLAARRAASQFARPRTWRGLLQLATSFGPFLAGCAAMYLVMPYSTLLALLLALPTGALLLRVFIVQHDCGHGSFLPSRHANALVGRLCSLITLTPYANWARQHAQHHAAWNDLDRPGGSDIYSSCLTVRAYLAMPPHR